MNLHEYIEKTDYLQNKMFDEINNGNLENLKKYTQILSEYIKDIKEVNRYMVKAYERMFKTLYSNKIVR